MRSSRSAATLTALLVSAASATAEGKTITRTEAWAAGSAHGPSVAVARAASAAAGALGGAAKGLSIPPRVTLMAGPRFGSLGTGLDWTATALIDLPLRPLGAARSATAEALVRTTEIVLAGAQAEGGQEAADAWARSLEAKEVTLARERGEHDLEAIVSIATKRWKSGVGLPSEVAFARGDLGAAGAATLDAEGMLVDALADLRFATGASADESLEAVGDLCVTQDEPLDEPKTLEAAETRSLPIALAKARSRLAAADVKLAHAAGGPTIGFGAQYYRDALGEQVISGIVTVPLPFIDPTRFDTTRAQVAADETAAEVERVRAIVRKNVRLAIHDRVHTREVRTKLLRDALEPLREAVRLARVQYEAGTQDLTSVLVTRQRLFVVEEQVLRACSAVHRADFALARWTGKAPS